MPGVTGTRLLASFALRDAALNDKIPARAVSVVDRDRDLVVRMRDGGKGETHDRRTGGKAPNDVAHAERSHVGAAYSFPLCWTSTCHFGRRQLFRNSSTDASLAAPDFS